MKILILLLSVVSVIATQAVISGRVGLAGRMTVSRVVAPAASLALIFSDIHFSAGFPSNTVTVSSNQVGAAVTLVINTPDYIIGAPETAYVYFKVTSGTSQPTNLTASLNASYPAATTENVVVEDVQSNWSTPIDHYQIVAGLTINTPADTLYEIGVVTGSVGPESPIYFRIALENLDVDINDGEMAISKITLKFNYM